MSQININADLDAHNADLQDQVKVRGTGGQPRADLPPELQYARPSKRSVFARIGAFLFGAGAAGGTAAAFGAGTLLSGALGAGATTALGGAAVVTGIATGGAALIGGAIGLGLFAGIRAIVRYFTKAPDPAPRLNGLLPGGLPNAQPAADAFNSSVADAVNGRGQLPASLQQAADDAVSRMRDVYGEDLVPQGATLGKILDIIRSSCCSEIRGLGDAVTPGQIAAHHL